MSDFTSQAHDLLAEACRRFGLRLVALDESNVALVGTTHAVVIGDDRDDVLVFYVERRLGGRLLAYNIGTWVDGRFTPEDRATYGSPHSLVEYRDAALRVVATGLTYRCADVLSGDRGWLDALRKRDPDSWQPLSFVPGRDALEHLLQQPTAT